MIRGPTGVLGSKVRRSKLKRRPLPAARSFVPTSVVLQRLHDEAPTDCFTLGWLMGSLRKRSFGIVMLLLAVVAVAPGVSIIASLLLMIPAFQMIEGHPAPIFPRRIATHPFPTRHLAALVQRAVPVLRYLEKISHPRWPTPLEATKRLVGVVVVILNIAVVFTPIPLGAVVPALVIALISLAYLEEDGLLLAIALLAAVIVLTVAVAAVWQTVRGAQWLSGLWQLIAMARPRAKIRTRPPVFRIRVLRRRRRGRWLRISGGKRIYPLSVLSSVIDVQA
jgi:hypothetical protein